MCTDKIAARECIDLTLGIVFGDSDSDSCDSFHFLDDSSSDSDLDLPTLEDTATQVDESLIVTQDSLLGKRSRNQVNKAIIRGGVNLDEAKEALARWLDDVYVRIYAKSSLSKNAIIAPRILSAIARRRSIRTFEDLKEQLGRKWHYVDKHGQEVIRILEEVEEKRSIREEAKREKDRLAKAAKAAKKKHLQKENEAVNGITYTFVQYDPFAPKKRGKKPLAQSYPPVASTSSNHN